MRRMIITMAFLAAAGFVVSGVMAADGDPKQAKKFQVELVAAHDQCGGTPLTTGGLGLPACSPVLSEPTCTFGPEGKGKGKLKAQADTKTGDIKTQINMGGLACTAGDVLIPTVDFQSTSDNCLGGPTCTTNTSTLPLLGTDCTVDDKGKCKSKTTINAALGAGTITLGDATTVAIGSVRLVKGGGNPAFTAGLYIP
jgi:hypothetical protein